MSGLNETPSGSRVHIGIFGRRNAGKSSIINAITGQDVAIVSDVKGTTTDPVAKAMELLPLGPVKIFDTPGLDDEGELGHERMRRSLQVLNKSDLALLIVVKFIGCCLRSSRIPYIIMFYTKKEAAPRNLFFINNRPSHPKVRYLRRIETKKEDRKF